MKIAVIGGAGVRTVIFINGLLKRYKKLHIDEVVLYDIQEEKQRIIEKLCKHVVERNHEELKVWFVFIDFLVKIIYVQFLYHNCGSPLSLIRCSHYPEMRFWPHRC